MKWLSNLWRDMRGSAAWDATKKLAWLLWLMVPSGALTAGLLFVRANWMVIALPVALMTTGIIGFLFGSRIGQKKFIDCLEKDLPEFGEDFLRSKLSREFRIKVGGSFTRGQTRYSAGDIIRPTQKELESFGDGFKTPKELAAEWYEYRQRSEGLAQELAKVNSHLDIRERDLEWRGLIDELERMNRVSETKRGLTAEIIYVRYDERDEAQRLMKLFSDAGWEAKTRMFSGDSPPEPLDRCQALITSGDRELPGKVHVALDRAKRIVPVRAINSMVCNDMDGSLVEIVVFPPEKTEMSRGR